MAKTLTIDGYNIHDISSFYDEINRVFMHDNDWKLGESLDALNDMFYGGYGKMEGNEEIELVWTNFEKNRKDLGTETTRIYYHNKLKPPGIFNTNYVKEKLDELENGTGKTYFDIILDIIGEHPNIRLIPK